ncbi:cation:dicarboxylase symporter family transporter [Sphaerisporangium sp. NPDC088356]|uniref:cation:dicarboxylate symporter family transporter n=1 Tax=Sphaerisporangium sp. NPDC088356 TaxID=3154871 RepID=UPI0034400D9E
MEVRWSRALPAGPSSVTVIADAAGRYFASFVVEVPGGGQVLPEVGAETGIDLGLTHYAILSDGSKVANPKWLRRRERKLAKLQRILSGKKKGSRMVIGLVVGNLVHPGEGLQLTDELRKAAEDQAAKGGESDTTSFLLGIIPLTFVSAFTEGQVLQTLLVALLTGFALQAMGERAVPILNGLAHIQRLVFRVLAMIMWAAPVGAFGAMAAVVGAGGFGALRSLALLMAAFYVTCLLFVGLILGPMLWFGAGMNLLSLLRYLGREFLLILSTSSSESALPRLIAKMEHLGVSRAVAGITVPTGYSFNLDGTAIYLTMATLFVARATGAPLSIGEQVSLLVFMIIASKGAAGVTGAGLATLAGGLQSHRPELVDGVGLIVGIDRFMSEARALTNFAGNAVATVLIGTWVRDFDRERAEEVLSGRIPFDEATFVDEHDGTAPPPASEEPVPAGAGR